MELHNLRPAKGATKNPKKRLGRGQGSGKGGTSTRGHKGAQSHGSWSIKRGFEGGQMPLQRRIPKYGFKNPFRKEFHGINLDSIQKLADKKKLSVIEPSVLIENGLASKNDRIKILGRGELKTKVDVRAHAFSGSAKAAIEKAGGKTELVGAVKPVVEKKEKSK